MSEGSQTLVTPMRKSSPEARARLKKFVALLTMSWRLSSMEEDSSETQMMSALGMAWMMVSVAQPSETLQPQVASAVPLDRSLTSRPVGCLRSA